MSNRSSITYAALESTDDGTDSPLMSLPEKDLDAQHAESGHRCKSCHRKSFSRWLVGLVILLGVLCIGLAVALIAKMNTPNDVFRHIPDAKMEIIHTPGVAPPMLGPEFTKRTMVFHRNESFMYEKKKAYPAWHDILHRARHGRVAFDSRPGEFFGISGYHELHCVWLLQQAVDFMVNGPIPDELAIDHMYHCAEFLRQSVMCHADATIERRFEGILGPFSANNTHVCGDWDALMDWADDHIYLGPYLNPHEKLPP